MKMFFWLLFLVWVPLDGFGQLSPQTAAGNSTLMAVQRENDYRLQIDSCRKNLVFVQRDLSESAEGGIVNCFHSAGDTLKKEITYYGETGKRTVEIYFRRGSAVLVEDTYIRYEEPIRTGRDVVISQRRTDLYYLDDEQHIVYWLRDGQKMQDSEYENQEKKIITE